MQNIIMLIWIILGLSSRTRNRYFEEGGQSKAHTLSLCLVKRILGNAAAFTYRGMNDFFP